MNYPFVTCAFCKARHEGPAHRCLTGPVAFPEPPSEATDYERGFADGWDAAMRFVARPANQSSVL